MPGGRTKFQEKWLENKDLNNDTVGNWCTKSKTEWEAYCILCRCSFSISNGGMSQIMQHSKTVKHLSTAKQMKGQKTLGFMQKSSNTENSSRLVTTTTEKLVFRAEALWALKVAASNYSFNSCKDVVPIFKTMFENNPIANNMQLGDKKISYVLGYGLGPYFHDEFVSDLKTAIECGNFFTIAFDETTNAQIKKQLDVIVRFWSPKFDQIIAGYLTSIFMGHATANDIFNGILQVLEADKLPLNKILMISMDGPNVNHSVVKKFNERLVNSGASELINVSTCTLHKVHNCFSKALSNLPLDIDEFASDIFSFFKISPARREDFKTLEQLFECEEKFLLRHVNSRWLTLGPVIDRILSLYTALQEYFLCFLPKQKSSWQYLQNNGRYKRITSCLKDPLTKIYLEFVSSIFPTLQVYQSLFQTEAPLIHIMHNKINLLLRSVMLRVLTEETVGNLEGENLCHIDLNDFKNYRPLKNMNVGERTKRSLMSVKINEAKEARMAMRSFLVKLSKLLREALPISDSLLKDLEKLHPAMRSTVQSDNAIRSLCLKLKPLQMDTNLIDNIMLEFQLYRMDPEVDKLCQDLWNPEIMRIDEFWKNIFGMTDKFSGSPKYQNLAVLVKNCLSLTHGNADVERGFSINNSLVTARRSCLAEKTIVAIRHIKDAKQRYGDILKIPITEKMLDAVSKSHSKFVAAKEAEKLEAEKLKQKRKREEEEETVTNEKKKLKETTEEKLKNVNNMIKLLEDDLSSAQKCLSEGNKKLQAAIKSKNYDDMKIASTLIDAGTSKIDEVSKELNKKQQEKCKLSLK